MSSCAGRMSVPSQRFRSALCAAAAMVLVMSACGSTAQHPSSSSATAHSTDPSLGTESTVTTSAATAATTVSTATTTAETAAVTVALTVAPTAPPTVAASQPFATVSPVTDPPPAPPPAATTDQVRQAQIALNRLFGAGLTEDGLAGAKTTASITKFQGESGLPVTGVLDDQTLASVTAASANVQTGPLKLSGKGIGEASLGEDPDATVSYLSAHFGRPAGDSGWTPVPIGQPCSVKETREVRWGDLLVTFAASDPRSGSASGRRQFVSVDFSLDAQESPAKPAGMKSDRGLKLGDQLSRLFDLYPNATYDDTGNDPFGPTYSVPGEVYGTLLTGARDVIGSIGAGVFPCGE